MKNIEEMLRMLYFFTNFENKITVDEMGVDEVGVDEMGVDEVGVNEMVVDEMG